MPTSMCFILIKLTMYIWFPYNIASLSSLKLSLYCSRRMCKRRMAGRIRRLRIRLLMEILVLLF